jgi:predicted transcriptional regulator of viral defense system
MAVTRLARRKRPDLAAHRPQGVEGLVWDALVLEARPIQVKDIQALTELAKVQVCKAIGRLKKRGVVDGYRVPGNPTGYRMAYHLVAA